jgi:WD40 repeat protein
MCQFLRLFEGHSGEVRAVAVTPNGQQALSGSHDRTLRLWDLASGECLRIFGGHTESVWGLAVGSDGRQALSSSADKTLRLWDLTSGQWLHTFVDHTDARLDPGGGAMAMTPDGRHAFFYSGYSILRMWDLVTGQCLHMFKIDDVITTLAMAPDGRTLLLGGFTNVRVWTLPDGLFV